jgi:hypothetical protein
MFTADFQPSTQGFSVAGRDTRVSVAQPSHPLADSCPGPNFPIMVKERPMPKMRKRSDLPTKICAACSLRFIWRKKWERVWEDVRFCSDRCRKTGVKRESTAAPR